MTTARPSPVQPLEDIRSEFDIEYGRVGDVPLLLDLYHPASNFKPPYPTVIWIHGGGWRTGDKRDPKVVRIVLSLARAGFLTVSINYRLSQITTFPGQLQDCKCAVRWMRAHAQKYQVDPDRIGASGRSAGGHLALMLGTTAQSEFEGEGGWADQKSSVRAVTTWAAPTNLILGNVAPDSPRVQLMGGPPDQKKKEFEWASPVNHVSSKTVPTLLFHGDKDEVVNIQQAELMYAALKEKGVECGLVRVKNATHVVPPDRVTDPTLDEVNQAMAAFFGKHLRGS